MYLDMGFETLNLMLRESKSWELTVRPCPHGPPLPTWGVNLRSSKWKQAMALALETLKIKLCELKLWQLTVLLKIETCFWHRPFLFFHPPSLCDGSGYELDFCIQMVFLPRVQTSLFVSGSQKKLFIPGGIGNWIGGIKNPQIESLRIEITKTGCTRRPQSALRRSPRRHSGVNKGQREQKRGSAVLSWLLSIAVLVLCAIFPP